MKECKGSQFFDGFNDVAWLRLGRNTLGVTWFGTSIDETDVALNTTYSWSIGGDENTIDVETVFLHENGHVAGLGHSDVQEAVMYASYQKVRTTLHSDDIAGISALYPEEATAANDAPVVTITSPTDGSTFDSGATILFEGTASDTEDGDLTASLVWTSNIDGDIGTGGSFSATLSDGNHTITAEVTDSGGKTGSDSISITVGTPPTEPTTVSVASITYATEGGRKQDKHLLVTVALVDDFDDSVAGASVSIDLFRDGNLVAYGTATTGTGGTVTFTLKNARAGHYTTTVTNVSAEGLTWDRIQPKEPDPGFDKTSNNRK